jgi:acetyl esterase/lipase
MKVFRNVAAKLAIAFAFTALAVGGDMCAPVILELWAGKPPGQEGEPVVAEQAETQQRGGESVVVRITNVSIPKLHIYPAPKATATGAAAVVCPGGGYSHLDWDDEGVQTARWLNSIGVTAAILKYRVPRRDGTALDLPPPMALMDAQRALSLVRSRGADWGVDPARLGIIGFSAGGHLAAWASTAVGKRAYQAADQVDTHSCAADFSVICYPYGVINFASQRYDPRLRVVAGAPPAFLVVASDDNFCVENAIAYYSALRKQGIAAELHAYETGGHSFAFRATGKPSAQWPKRCEEWMSSRKLLTTAK